MNTEIIDALHFIPCHDRELWVAMGMAIKDELGDAGFDIWDQWSQADSSYNEKDARAVWKSFKGNGTTIEYLFKQAIHNGYKPPAKVTEQHEHPDQKARREEERKAAEAKCKREKEKGAADAERRWNAAQPETGQHKYLITKGVLAHGIRTNGIELLIPMLDTSGKIHGLQEIRPAATATKKQKQYATGSSVTGHYFPIGKLDDCLVICEGFATAASIFEATEHAVAVAFDAGNLKPVAEALREKFPAIRIVIAADDDHKKKENKGLSKATAAAKAVRGLLAVPAFGDDRPAGATDFNDLATHKGQEAVKAQIEAAQRVPAAASRKQDIAPDQVLTRRACDIESRVVNWLWQDYLAQGSFHLVAGAPATGKTTLAIDFAAVVSSGGYWPDGTRAEQGSVVIWSGEDSPEHTLVPRLIAAGADLTRVHIVSAVLTEKGRRPFDPATDMVLLRQQLDVIADAKLLVVDPVVSAIAGDSHKNAETRRGLQPLVDIALDYDIAALGVTHYTKGTTGKDPLERVTGSLAFGALARMVFGTADSTEEDAPKVFCRVKSNLGPSGGGFEYDIAVTDIENGIRTTRIQWGQPLEGDARDILAACEAESDDASNQREDAGYWLRSELEDGPVTVKELKKAAGEAGHQWHTVKRAKFDIGAEAEKSGFHGGWRWYLPKGADAEEPTTTGAAPFGAETPKNPSVYAGSIEGSRGCSLGAEESTKGAGGAPFDETRATQGFEADSDPEGSSSACGKGLEGDKAGSAPSDPPNSERFR